MALFTSLQESVRVNVQPEGRANAMIGTLGQLESSVPDGVTLPDIVKGWQIIAWPREGDDGRITARRRTCDELARLAEVEPSSSSAKAIETWAAWQKAFEGSSDPRQAAMAATFGRELEELKAS